MKRNHLVLLLLFVIFVGCKSGQMAAFLQGVNKGLAAQRGSSNYSATVTKLMLFGGKNNKQYLGCLNCDKTAIDSIFNEYGTYGSSYGITSIWNSYGQYGSRYSIYSPWNPHTTTPPVIVDSEGNFYGYFTVNQYLPNRTRTEWILRILDVGAMKQ